MRARGPLLTALSAFVLWFGVACATTAPVEPARFAPVPRKAEAPSAHPPAAIAELENTDPASLLGRAVPESPSLLFVRDVLDRKAAKLSAVEREGVARELVVAEAEHGISVLYSLALMDQESRFDPRAKGSTGSLGLMQLQPVTAREVARRHGLAWQSERTLCDPVQNVRLGLAYLAELRARFGSTDHAMAAYNIGPNALRRLLAKRPLRHGPYLKKVHAKADAMRSEFSVPEIAIGG
jgi:soluble lytic murein transglycosylase-like protein